MRVRSCRGDERRPPGRYPIGVRSWPAILVLVAAAACRGGDLQPAIDAAIDAPPGGPGGCSVDPYRVGPPGLTDLAATVEGTVIYAAFATGGAGFSISATELDGHSVLPPIQVDSTLNHPAAVAVNGG